MAQRAFQPRAIPNAEGHVARRGETSAVVSSLPSSGIRRFFEMLDSMEGVISLGVGQPDFATPPQVTRAAMDAMVEGRTGYTSNYGLLEVRELLSQQLERRYGVSYSPKSEILLTTGVSEALDLACRALIDPGDEVLVPEPAYVAFQPVILLAGGRYVAVPTTAEDQFMVTAEQLEQHITPATKAVLLAYPSNPTGAVMSRRALEQVADVVRRHDLWVISDETYDRLVYGHDHVCFSAIPGMRERTILLGGFSKAYAMTGWRLGFTAAPPVVLEEMMKVHQYVMMSAPSAAQYAALEALQSGEEDVRGMVAEYDRRRKLVFSRLRGMGLPVVEPKGAFYIFPDISSTGLDDLEFCERLLVEERVAVIPGASFGESGKGFVRICYASAYADLEEAMNRLERFLTKRRAEVGTK
ncbi:MAG: aminotransferase class I/II-fold pyridoxal phosphate-dependent enzyme [Dehalococcoidia bacterium]|nr:aminotransferase class I/II-fold pyridoxal phosphate-dependent enzyme [Dehalococcoidia bacterium]